MNRNQFSIITIIHWALAMPMIVFGAVVYYLNVTQSLSPAVSSEILLFIPGMFLVAAFPLSGILFNRALAGLNKNAELKTKINTFQSAHILRMALFEAAGILGCVVSYITATSYNLIVVAIALGFFVLYQPSIDKVQSLLELDAKEREQLNQ